LMFNCLASVKLASSFSSFLLFMLCFGVLTKKIKL
jgi:hypothetical protein